VAPVRPVSGHEGRPSVQPDRAAAVVGDRDDAVAPRRSHRPGPHRSRSGEQPRRYCPRCARQARAVCSAPPATALSTRCRWPATSTPPRRCATGWSTCTRSWTAPASRSPHRHRRGARRRQPPRLAHRPDQILAGHPSARSFTTRSAAARQPDIAHRLDSTGRRRLDSWCVPLRVLPPWNSQRHRYFPAGCFRPAVLRPPSWLPISNRDGNVASCLSAPGRAAGDRVDPQHVAGVPDVAVREVVRAQRRPAGVRPARGPVEGDVRREDAGAVVGIEDQRVVRVWIRLATPSPFPDNSS